MKALIIDDEKKARQLLIGILKHNCGQLQEIEEASALSEGVKKINQFKPDIVFLDIEMPGYSGLQLFEFFEPSQISFEIIFITAYSEHAIRAFQLNAIDYLLKPLKEEQLIKAVEKATQQIGKSKISERLEELNNSLKAPKIKKVGLPVSDGVLFIKFDDIIMLEADRMYTKVFTTGDGEILVSKPMKFLMDAIGDLPEFYKPHRSYMINLKFIKRYVNKEGGYILMENDQQVNLSKEKKIEFLNAMKSI